MPATYVNLASSTLSSNQTTVTFSSINSSYTDLVLKGSIRDTNAASFRDLFIRLNNNSNAAYSFTDIAGTGSVVTSNQNTARSFFQGVYGSNGAGSTASTFASFELYIPSYNASTNKPASLFTATENNATLAYITQSAQLFRSTTAISRIDILGDSTFLSGSTFYLYGIKNS